MKVLVISAAYPPMLAGEASNAYHMCQRLADRGLDVHVLTAKGNTGTADPRIVVHDVMEKWSWNEAPRLAAFLRSCAPDSIYLMYLGWTYGYQFMSTFIPSIAKSVLPQTPFVTRFENIGGAAANVNSLTSRAVRWILAKRDPQKIDYQFGTLLRDSDTIVLLSSRHETPLESILPGVSNKCVLIPPPVNMCLSEATSCSRARGRAALGVGPEDLLLTFIGFVYPGKGIETLLQAFSAVSDRHPHLKLAILGGDIDRKFSDARTYRGDLLELSRHLGVEGRVIWTGPYSSDTDQASTYLRATDVCVLPFDTGVKLNNSSFSSAATHGLPILTTLDDSLEPQFVHGQNVYLCPPRSPEALASAVEILVGDDRLRARLAAGSLNLAKHWYSWETAIERTLQLLAEPASRSFTNRAPLHSREK
jgi:glycosyltransferase involved in cell wall biosynthesis